MKDPKSKKNKHGLDRAIPAEVKRKVRKNSGFGCVICGAGYWEYDHVEPEFADCYEHDANSITLLCVYHHGIKTKGLLSKERIIKAMNNPKSLQDGFSFERFEISDKAPIIRIGGAKFENVPIPIQIDNDPLITVSPPEEEGSPFLISGEFYDSTGKKSLILEKNEWKAYNENWDVDTVGTRVSIREKKGQISLILRSIPPNELIIEKLDMEKNGFIFKADLETLELKEPGGRLANFNHVISKDLNIGIQWDTSPPHKADVYTSWKDRLWVDSMDVFTNTIPEMYEIQKKHPKT